jgi:flavin reductase (DIM6/NTAB) family NADH-FMN oxidoreductase RutF
MSVEPRVVDAAEFRKVLGRFATGVTIVTTCQGNRRAGITVNAFASVSLEPPLVLVCIERRNYAHDLITQSRIFAVNVLTAEQADVSRCFASRSNEKIARFCGVTTHDEVTGAPVFDQCAGFVDCQLEAVYPGGDHSIFVGRVMALGGADVPPLLYYSGKYGQLYENELELGPSTASQ